MRSKHKGFTLIETMVVLIIIGVLAAATAPMMVSLLRRTKVTTEATNVSSLFSSMRSQALTRGYPTVVCVHGKDAPAPVRNSMIAFRKFAPVLAPNLPTATTAGLVLHTPLLPTDDKKLDERRLENQVELVFPEPATDNTKTLQFVFDMNGGVTVFQGDTCGEASNAGRTLIDASLGLVFQVRFNDGGTSPITQEFKLRRDGTVALP